MMTTSARAYSAANVMLMRNESTSADTLVAMLASCGAQGMQGMQGLHGMQGTRSVGGLEEAMMGGQKRPFYPVFETSDEIGDDDAADDCSHHVEKKRRLTVDQVRSLEKNFEVENKLEPERKMQLARELGLQPRQVAVWFQNRRARWKTKQLERDYDVLKLDYDALKSDYDTIVEDKESLQAEIHRLTSKLKAQSEQTRSDGQSFEEENVASHADMGLSADPAEADQQQQEDGVASQQTQEYQQAMPQQQQDYQQTGVTVTTTTTTAATICVKNESPVKSKGGSTSSESNSSEIMNADSPHPIDSDLSPVGAENKAFICGSTLPSSTGAAQDPSNVDTSLVQLAEELCGGRLGAGHSFPRSSVKLEDGVPSSNILQEDCSNYFYTMDENGSLPWWEWP